MAEPYLKLARRFFEHPFWEETRTFSRAEAWIDLVRSAQFRSRTLIVQGRTIKVGRGQLVASIRYLARRWLWSIAKTKRFLDRLETDTMIETATEQGITIVTLCNYETYNSDEPACETPTETPASTSAERSRNTRGTKKKKERRKEEENIGEEDQPGEIPLLLNTAEFRAAWADWKRDRTQRRKTLTPTAIRLQLATLEQWGSDKAVRSLRRSIEMGYTGIFDPDLTNHGTTKTTHPDRNAGTCNAGANDWSAQVQRI